MTESLSAKIQLFKSLFKGRGDVFAVRWEIKEKSGYMPAYYYDPYLYRTHKMKGGSFKNYNDKSYLKLTADEIAKHLNGEQHIGIYSLLTDNTSWFLAADFDKESWIDQSKDFINACSEKGIPAYLERSRSGNGGHVWIFFEQPYPAVKSRKIFVSLLEHFHLKENLHLYSSHIDKSKQALMKKVKEIDEQLGVIRNKGRQAFLESSPENFSRVLHDYADERKGFVIWKDLIEERII